MNPKDGVRIPDYETEEEYDAGFEAFKTHVRKRKARIPNEGTLIMQVFHFEFFRKDLFLTNLEHIKNQN